MRIKIISLALVTVAILLGIALAGSGTSESSTDINHVGYGHKLTVYKSSTCGCCALWVSYMKDRGYDVDFVDTESLNTVKAEYNIPESLHSCHTTIINDGEYFVEGHIPEEAVSKLLKEKPNISGIGMPGMPSASPGMPGKKLAPFEITQVTKDGQTGQYMSI